MEKHSQEYNLASTLSLANGSHLARLCFKAGNFEVVDMDMTNCTAKIEAVRRSDVHCHFCFYCMVSRELK